MRHCYFCTNNISQVDYKKPDVLQKFLDPYGRLVTRRKSNLCAGHQRQLSRAVKNARFLALLPFLPAK